MADYEEVESSSNSNVIYRRPKTSEAREFASVPSTPLTNGPEKRISTTRNMRDFLTLDINKAAKYNNNNNQVDLDNSKGSRKVSRMSNSPEPSSIQSPTVKKSKSKLKKSSKDSKVCAAEIGPAIAKGINIGASILTSNGSPSPNTPISSRRSSPVDNDTSENDSSDSDYEDYVEETKGNGDVPECPIPHDQGKETVNTIIPCNIDQLFTMVFTKSKFYLDFHTSRKTFDIVQSEWNKAGDGTQKSRTVTFTITLANLMGPKHSYVTETQTLLPVSTPGLMYAVESETVNAGIPYADSFYVTTHFCLSSISANESRLIIINQIKFRKSVWGVKNFIEKNSWAGINDFYCNLARALKEECTKSDFIGDSPKRTADGTSRKRRVNKGPAPSAPVIPRHGSIIGVSMSNAGGHMQNSQLSDNSLVLKVLLSVLAGLLLLNGFLFLKLGSLETIANSPSAMFSQPLVLPKEIPQSHQEWLLLLQHQESLHRLELQKWHEILSAALHILNQAENGLESLKAHIVSSYPPERKSAEGDKQKAVHEPEIVLPIDAIKTTSSFDSVQRNSTIPPLKPLSTGKTSL